MLGVRLDQVTAPQAVDDRRHRRHQVDGGDQGGLQLGRRVLADVERGRQRQREGDRDRDQRDLDRADQQRRDAHLVGGEVPALVDAEEAGTVVTQGGDRLEGEEDADPAGDDEHRGADRPEAVHEDGVAAGGLARELAGGRRPGHGAVPQRKRGHRCHRRPGRPGLLTVDSRPGRGRGVAARERQSAGAAADRETSQTAPAPEDVRVVVRAGASPEVSRTGSVVTEPVSSRAGRSHRGPVASNSQWFRGTEEPSQVNDTRTTDPTQANLHARPGSGDPFGPRGRGRTGSGDRPARPASSPRRSLRPSHPGYAGNPPRERAASALAPAVPPRLRRQPASRASSPRRSLRPSRPGYAGSGRPRSVPWRRTKERMTSDSSGRHTTRSGRDTSSWL